MHPYTLKPCNSVDAMWLTDPTVPNADPIWAVRRTILRNKRAAAFIPREPTMWWDMRNNIVYYADFEEITDFASTPAGDGQKGVMRGSGRLHDQMAENTPVLLPHTSKAAEELLKRVSEAEVCGHILTPSEVCLCGYEPTTKDISIWEAGRLYSRMLRSAGFPVWRAALQRAGLRSLGLQHLYRTIWIDEGWEYAGDRAV